MKNLSSQEEFNKILDDAYKCKPGDLEHLLQKIEFEIKNSDYIDRTLLRAKTIVTSKMALMNNK